MTAPSPTRAPTRSETLQACVARAVADLGRRASERDPSAAAILARLRRAVSVEPGSEPAVWAQTIGILPPHLMGRTDTPNDAERAVHATVCLFAVHQQAQSAGVHGPQHGGLGRAVRLYGRQTSSEEATRRRFQALGTAGSFFETLHHLRGLITQLRAEAISLDYGRLARDLLELQDPARAGSVRLRWGRDYHRQDPSDPEQITEFPAVQPDTAT